MPTYNTAPKQRDAALQAKKYLPAANATNYSDSFDLFSTGFVPDGMVMEVAIPASALHISTNHSFTVTLQDSADNSSFANVSPLTQISVVGVATVGSSAVTKRIRIPDGTRRYVRFAQAVPDGDGDLTTDEVVYSVCVW
jgi:hypothetical protein